jgi:hypothetical protein
MSSFKTKYVADKETPALVDDSTDDVWYFGYPKNKSSAISASEWAIKKITNAAGIYSLNLWAGGSKEKNKAWSNRKSLTFSRVNE